MRIEKRNAARLASLSALGAGALGVAAGTAEASDIVYTILPNIVVGPGGIPAAHVALPGGDSFSVVRHTWKGTWKGARVSDFSVAVLGYHGGVQFRILTSRSGGNSSALAIVGRGKKWSSAGATTTGVGFVAARLRSGGGSSVRGDPSFTDQYALFGFWSGGHTLIRLVRVK